MLALPFATWLLFFLDVSLVSADGIVGYAFSCPLATVFYMYKSCSFWGIGIGWERDGDSKEILRGPDIEKYERMNGQRSKLYNLAWPDWSPFHGLWQLEALS